MPRSMLAGLVTLAASLVVACAQTSKSPSSVTAPTTSAAGPTTPEPSAAPSAVASSAPAPSASALASATATPTPGPAASTTGPGADVGTAVPARYRACRADADCVVVPRAGCCHNGWNEAVAASQKGAYERAFACTTTPHPMCPMYIVQDKRVAKCEGSSHLCELVQP